MKYIISENRVNDFIIKYLEKTYGGLRQELAWDDNIEEVTDCAIEFSYQDDEDEDGEIVFRLYDKCWWNISSSEAAREMYNKSPILRFEYESEFDTLNSYFGDLWKEPFKKWFKEYYGFNIKTIEY